MKHRIVCAVALALLAGCASGAAAEPPAVSPTAPAQTADSEAGGPSVHWVHSPDIRLSGIYELEADSYWESPGTTVNEKLGYPQDWDDTWKPEYQKYSYSIVEPFVNENYVCPLVTNYTPDAIGVVIDGIHGIYDYAGTARMKPCLGPDLQNYFSNKTVSYQPGAGFITGVKDDFAAGVFSNDFRYIRPGTPAGVGGDPGIGYYAVNDVLMRSDQKVTDPYIVDAHGHNCLVRVTAAMPEGFYIDDKDITGYSLYDVNAKLLHTFEGVFPLYYVNGFCSMSTEPTVFDMNENALVNHGRIALYNMTDYQPVTEHVYTDAKWFESGFCPVCRDGKWGFIDEAGKEVTDLVFDDVSVVYEGKAYVGIGGVYGVLDLAETVREGIPVTMETCYPNGVPEGIPAETGTIPTDMIGTIKVRVSNLNTRSKPDVSGEKHGKLFENSVYPVYEIRRSDEYTWYRIDETTWAADKNGEWLEYTEK